MRHLVVRGAYLQVPYQEAAGRRRWRYATVVNGAIVPPDVPAEALARFVASGHVRQISDEEAARLPRAPNPLHNLF